MTACAAAPALVSFVHQGWFFQLLNEAAKDHALQKPEMKTARARALYVAPVQGWVLNVNGTFCDAEGPIGPGMREALADLLKNAPERSEVAAWE